MNSPFEGFGFTTQGAPEGQIGINQQVQNFPQQAQIQQGFPNQFGFQQDVFSQFQGFNANPSINIQNQSQFPVNNQPQLQQQIVPQFSQQQFGGMDALSAQNQPQQNQMDHFGDMQQQQQLYQMNQSHTNQTPAPVLQPPKPQKLRVKLENSERGVYSALYTQVDPNETNSIIKEKAIEFLTRSGVGNQTVQNIWTICVPEGDTIDRDSFYVALRLVAYAQNNIEVSDKSITFNLKSPQNPKFAPKSQAVIYNASTPAPQTPIISSPVSLLDNQSINNSSLNVAPKKTDIISQFTITEDNFQQYEKYFEMTDNQKIVNVNGQQAKQLFSKSQVSNEVLKHIWSLADIEKRGYLNKNQFFVMVHLVSLAKKNISIPSTLPPELLNFISTNRDSIQSKPINSFNQSNSLTSSSYPLDPQLQINPQTLQNSQQNNSFPIQNNPNSVNLNQNQGSQITSQPYNANATEKSCNHLLKIILQGINLIKYVQPYKKTLLKLNILDLC